MPSLTPQKTAISNGRSESLVTMSVHCEKNFLYKNLNIFTVSYNDITFNGGACSRGHLYIAISKKGSEITWIETSV